MLVQVSVDANGALTAALAGLASLPEQFFEQTCSDPADLAKEALVAFNEEKRRPRATLDNSP